MTPHTPIQKFFAMRFCLFSTQKNWGGGEELLFSIAKQLQADGHTVTWVVRSESRVQERIVAESQQVLAAPRRRGLALGDLRKTGRLLREWAPDVVVFNDTHAVLQGGFAAARCRKPSPIRLAFKHTVFPLRSAFKYRWLSDRVICVSRAARDVVTQGGLSESHTEVIYGGVTLPETPQHARESLVDELGIAEASRPILLCVGNLLPVKGHRFVIEAMRELTRNDVPPRLLIAGSGEQKSALESMVESFGLKHHVHLLGYRDDALRLIAAADLVVHPSLAEGLSLVLIQAQLLAKPIVATAVGGTREVLASDLKDECSAWIVEPESASSLTGQIQSALLELEQQPPDLQQKLVRTRDRTQRMFSLAGNTRQLVDFCDELISQR